MPAAGPRRRLPTSSRTTGDGATQGSGVMSTLTSTLLDFILSLLRDPQAAQAFNDHPEQALSDAGLNDVCSADVQSLMPMLADYAPAGVSPYHSSGVSPYHHENNDSEDNYPKHRDQGRDNYQHGSDHDSGYQAI